MQCLANANGHWTNTHATLAQCMPCTLPIWDDIEEMLVSDVAITQTLALCICTMWTNVAQLKATVHSDHGI